MYERVLVTTRELGDQFAGQNGTVVWSDGFLLSHKTAARKEWAYCVSLTALGCYGSFGESDLEPTGEFDTEQAEWGTRFELSCDTEIGDDMEIVEGTYRLPGCLWQVFLFTRAQVPELRHKFGTWVSGITGVEIEVPENVQINHEYIMSAMSSLFGADAWTIMKGPDSLILK